MNKHGFEAQGNLIIPRNKSHITHVLIIHSFPGSLCTMNPIRVFVAVSFRQALIAETVGDSEAMDLLRHAAEMDNHVCAYISAAAIYPFPKM